MTYYDHHLEKMTLSKGRMLVLHFPVLLNADEADDIEAFLLLSIKGIKRRALLKAKEGK